MTRLSFYRWRPIFSAPLAFLLAFQAALLAGPALPGAEPAPAPAEIAVVAVSKHRLAESVRFLSSDELGGRGVGTAGIDKAGKYIADHFQKLGLKTDLFEGKPFQQFSINAAPKLGSSDKNRLVLSGPPAKEGGAPEKIVLELGTQFTPLASGGSASLNATAFPSPRPSRVLRVRS